MPGSKENQVGAVVSDNAQGGAVVGGLEGLPQSQDAIRFLRTCRDRSDSSTINAFKHPSFFEAGADRTDFM